jgi:hypothetical protein
MQINDSQPPAAPAPAGKDQVRPGRDDAARAGGPRSGRGFKDALDRKRRSATSAEGGQETANAAMMSCWFRPESPALTGNAAAAGRSGGVAAAGGVRAVDRVLIGAGPEGAEARIRIGAGALAGTEIQLSGGAGGHAVEARLLTHAASSRQTLSVVMDEIRSRLRDRGIVLSVRGPAAAARVPESEAAVTGADSSRRLSSGSTGTGG